MVFKCFYKMALMYLYGCFSLCVFECFASVCFLEKFFFSVYVYIRIYALCVFSVFLVCF